MRERPPHDVFRGKRGAAAVFLGFRTCIPLRNTAGMAEQDGKSEKYFQKFFIFAINIFKNGGTIIIELRRRKDSPAACEQQKENM